MMHATETVIAPVAVSGREYSIDVLRGVAVLGILAMNIRHFAMIGAAYFFPTSFGDLSGGNFVVWLLSDLLANTKFITIFSLLFGVGIALQWQRAAAADRPFAGLHYRRMFWLWVIGMLHAYLFWSGDILVTYATCGCVVFLARKARPARLVASGLIVLTFGSALSLLMGWSAPYWDPDQLAEFVRSWQPPADEVAAEIAALTGGWRQELLHRAGETFMMQTLVFWISTGWRAAGCMLLGMGLYKSRLLTHASDRSYWTWVGLAVACGLPLTGYGIWQSAARDWEPVWSFFVGTQYIDWGALLLALGYIGLVMLACRHGWWSALTVRLAAVGRMALTNYLLQTLICTTVFYGHGLGLFGQVSRVGQSGLVLATWTLLLIISPWWLARFRYGPAEWLWRSLAYRRRQPMRIS